MKLLFLYGPPAAGKLTVARELAKLTGFKLFHNHLTVDLVATIFEFGTPPFQRLVGKMRLDLFEAAAEAGVPGLIFTIVYAQGLDEPFLEQTLLVVGRHGGVVHFVQLTCPREELMRRVLLPSRREFHKIATTELLQEVLDSRELFAPAPFPESLCIDTSQVLPGDAAQQIVAHYKLAGG